MIVLLHVLIALTSIGCVSYAYIKPTATKLYVTYGMVTLTFLSGFYLVFSAPAHMVQSCMAGLAYTGIVSLGIVAARRKMTALQNNA